MNTAGQTGGILSPIVYAMLAGDKGSETPLLLKAGLYLFGGLCW